MGILRTDKISGLETPTAVTGSVLFDGSGDSLTIASTNDFAFGTGDFTIEMWVYHTDLTGQQTYFGDTNGNTAGIYTYKTTNNEISLYDTTQRSVSAANIIQVNTWYHVAWTRENGTLRAFLDGIKVDEDTYTGDFTTTQYYVGDTADTSSGEMIGYISNLRVLKGTALYTADFTPPVHELQPIGDTVLLCCNNPDSAGAEATGKTITVNGDAAASTVSPGLTRDFTSGTEFRGVTTFDTQGYFVPPSGTTTERFPDFAGVDSTSARGVFIMGRTGPTSTTNVMDYITIATTGNAQDFGDSSLDGDGSTGASSSTRGLIGGGGPSLTNLIQHIIISSTGDGQDFGDLTDARNGLGGTSNSTRGLFAGGTSPAKVNLIEFVTIASMGNAFDFGDLTQARSDGGGCSSPTRALFGGGYVSPARRDTIDYVTISTTGNAVDFGDLTLARDTNNGGVSSATRGLWGGGFHPGRNTIDYVTIASLGDAIDFGDLTSTTGMPAGVSSKIRGVWGGGTPGVNRIEYVTIATTGDATDFGDLTVGRYSLSDVSNGHGGLG